MTQYQTIGTISRYLGEEVRIRGWLYNMRSSGKVAFLIVRDGTGFLQAVAARNLMPETFDGLSRLTQESAIVVTGVVREDARAPGGYEMELRGLEVVHLAAEGYPVTHKEHGVEFLMDNRHLWLRTPRQNAIVRVRHHVVSAARNFLDSEGFVLVDSPILTPAACEGTTTLFETEYFGDKAYLSQSGQLYNEAAAMAFGRVYCFGPTFRAEKSKTRRHLVEFWMLEPEMAYCELPECLEVEERLVTAVIQHVLATCRHELDVLERDTSSLEQVKPPFPRISYDEALELLRENGREIEWGDDFGAPDETLISNSFEKPVFVYGFPSQCKAFYMQPHPRRQEVTLSADLLAPEGIGEIIGGGQRVHDLEILKARIQQHGLPEAAYRWYVDLRLYGSVPHSGFGMGIERLVSWITGTEHVRETIPFPRMINRIYP